MRPRGEPTAAVMALTGSLGLAFAVLAFRTPVTFETEFAQLAAVERRGIAAWQAIAAEARAGKLSPVNVANRIDRDVLPAWAEARERSVRLEAGPDADRLPKNLPEVFRLRHEAWSALAAAARGRDQELARRAVAQAIRPAPPASRPWR